MNNPAAILPPVSNGGKKTLGQLKATPARYKGGPSAITSK